jgi:hypothetical protein
VHAPRPCAPAAVHLRVAPLSPNVPRGGLISVPLIRPFVCAHPF